MRDVRDGHVARCARRRSTPAGRFAGGLREGHVQRERRLILRGRRKTRIFWAMRAKRASRLPGLTKQLDGREVDCLREGADARTQGLQLWGGRDCHSHLRPRRSASPRLRLAHPADEAAPASRSAAATPLVGEAEPTRSRRPAAPGSAFGTSSKHSARFCSERSNGGRETCSQAARATRAAAFAPRGQGKAPWAPPPRARRRPPWVEAAAPAPWL